MRRSMRDNTRPAAAAATNAATKAAAYNRSRPCLPGENRLADQVEEPGKGVHGDDPTQVAALQRLGRIDDRGQVEEDLQQHLHEVLCILEEDVDDAHENRQRPAQDEKHCQRRQEGRQRGEIDESVEAPGNDDRHQQSQDQVAPAPKTREADRSPAGRVAAGYTIRCGRRIGSPRSSRS